MKIYILKLLPTPHIIHLHNILNVHVWFHLQFCIYMLLLNQKWAKILDNGSIRIRNDIIIIIGSRLKKKKASYIFDYCAHL